MHSEYFRSAPYLFIISVFSVEGAAVRLTWIVSSEDRHTILETCWRLRHTERNIFLNKDAAQPGQSYDRYKKAFELLSVDDINKIESVPCMRNALLYGIGGGITFGAIHFISTRRIKSSWNWTFASSMVVMVATWQHCRSRRGEEMDKMRLLTEKYSDHHISNLKQQMSSSSESSVEEDYEGWNSDDLESKKTIALTANKTFDRPESALEFDKQNGLDLIELIKRLNLDYYNQIRLVNFIRKQGKDAVSAITPNDAFFSNDEYLIPAIESDPLLFQLTNDDDWSDDEQPTNTTDEQLKQLQAQLKQ
ncbi:hypothetical protein E3P86_03605, partial [Wallemia ichthyophaga]